MSTLYEDDRNPLSDRAMEIISELYQAAGDLEALCSGWPCEEVRMLAYRIAELEVKIAELEANQCKCPAKPDESRD